MKSHIEKTIEEAVRIRGEYTTNYHQRDKVDAEFSHAEQQLDELRESMISLSFFRGWFAEKRLRQLYKRRGQLNISRLDVRSNFMVSEHEAERHWRNNTSAYYNGALIEAAKEGVSIATNDYYALEKAQWQAANIAEGGDLYSPVESMRVDTLTNEELEYNLQRYPEMAWEFSDDELAAAREAIVRVPLTHTTQEGALLDSLGESTSSGIFSYSKLHESGLIATEFGAEGIRGFTLTLDEKMGLHKYVFMCLGSPYPGQHENQTAGVAIINSELLYDEACIVTPSDISHICADVFHGDGIERQRDLDSLAEYRSMVVSGKGWVEILTRRLASHRREFPDAPYPVKDCLTMGEIKYRDEVPGSAIAAILTTEEEVREYVQHISDDTIAWPSRIRYLT